MMSTTSSTPPTTPRTRKSAEREASVVDRRSRHINLTFFQKKFTNAIFCRPHAVPLQKFLKYIVYEQK